MCMQQCKQQLSGLSAQRPNKTQGQHSDPMRQHNGPMRLPMRPLLLQESARAPHSPLCSLLARAPRWHSVSVGAVQARGLAEWRLVACFRGHGRSHTHKILLGRRYGPAVLVGEELRGFVAVLGASYLLPAHGVFEFSNNLRRAGHNRWWKGR
jgi:hypothetical protein